MKIKIDSCTEPKKCLKCVNICPMKVLVVKPIGTKRMSSHVDRWIIKAIFKDLCDGCMKCVDVCPEGRFTLHF